MRELKVPASSPPHSELNVPSPFFASKASKLERTLHPSPFTDYRESINPKHPAPDPDFTPRRYYQVYEAKHGFQPNLSIVDLLFNMGPESIFYL